MTELTPASWLVLVRNHCAVENNLHWTLDALFKEDDKPNLSFDTTSAFLAQTTWTMLRVAAPARAGQFWKATSTVESDSVVEARRLSPPPGVLELPTGRLDVQSFRASPEELAGASSVEGGERALKLGRVRRGNLHPAEIGELRRYSDFAFRRVNGALWAQTFGQRGVIDQIRILLSALNRLPGYFGQVYRVLPADALPLGANAYRPGSIVVERGFTSTSQHFDFVRMKSQPRNPLLIIESRGGGREISAVASSTTEREVLFPPSTPFFVVSNVFDPVRQRQVICLRDVSGAFR